PPARDRTRTPPVAVAPVAAAATAAVIAVDAVTDAVDAAGTITTAIRRVSGVTIEGEA
ncbi:MAG: hypothetical protein H8F28_13665, partial [Fibrella sp.]|nr:hypothetical protein [Armatimonadota bacterium]